MLVIEEVINPSLPEVRAWNIFAINRMNLWVREVDEAFPVPCHPACRRKDTSFFTEHHGPCAVPPRYSPHSAQVSSVVPSLPLCQQKQNETQGGTEWILLGHPRDARVMKVDSERLYPWLLTKELSSSLTKQFWEGGSVTEPAVYFSGSPSGVSTGHIHAAWV